MRHELSTDFYSKVNTASKDENMPRKSFLKHCFCRLINLRCKQSLSLDLYRQRLQNSKLHINVSSKNFLTHETPKRLAYPFSYFSSSFTRVYNGSLDLYIVVPESLAFVLFFFYSINCRLIRNTFLF